MNTCADDLKSTDGVETGRTVLIRIQDTFDVFLAQQIVRTISRSIGLPPEKTLLQTAEIAEKGAGFTGPDANSGLLVINAHGSGAEAGLTIRAMDAGSAAAPADYLRDPDRGLRDRDASSRRAVG
ncbi:MAG: hypothetical protein WC881_06685 [Elusimicrobiota bacterium]|jgi:hypothetical protein